MKNRFYNINAMIIINGITKHFGNLVAVNDLNLQINEGEIFALLGPDGAGKTTILRLLCGALRPDAGNIKIKDIDLAKHPDKAREHIGYMPQRFCLYENLSVIQNINFFSDLYGVDKHTRQKRTEELLHISRLTQFADRLARHLSGGMKQKLALICSIIHNPPILLLDEPTTGVDPVSRRDFWKILYGLLSEDRTLVISTPYMDEAERCNRIAMIHEGKLLMVDTPSDLKQQINEKVIEIKCDRIDLVSYYLKSNANVISVQTFGDRIRIILKQIDAQIIISMLQSEGISVKEVNEVASSLEDVFISQLLKK